MNQLMEYGQKGLNDLGELGSKIGESVGISGTQNPESGATPTEDVEASATKTLKEELQELINQNTEMTSKLNEWSNKLSEIQGKVEALEGAAPAVDSVSTEGESGEQTGSDVDPVVTQSSDGQPTTGESGDQTGSVVDPVVTQSSAGQPISGESGDPGFKLDGNTDEDIQNSGAVSGTGDVPPDEDIQNSGSVAKTGAAPTTDANGSEQQTPPVVDPDDTVKPNETSDFTPETEGGKSRRRRRSKKATRKRKGRTLRKRNKRKSSRK